MITKKLLNILKSKENTLSHSSKEMNETDLANQAICDYSQKITALLINRFSSFDIKPFAEQSEYDRIVIISEDLIPDLNIKDSKIEYHQAISLGQINWVLKLVGPIDRLIDYRENSDPQEMEYWKRLIFHVRNGGKYQTVRNSAPNALMEMFASVSKEFRIKNTENEASELGNCIGELSVGSNNLVITKSGDHFVKHRHADASRFLEVRANGLQVEELARLKKQSFQSRAVVVNHEAEVTIEHMEAEFAIPELQLRRYTGRIGVIANSLIISDLDIIPDSFKFPLSSNLHNVNLIKVNADFARMSPKLMPVRSLKGSFYHVDSSNSGHFGHLMGEVLACLWGWPQAKAEDPSLKVLFRIRFPNERIPAIEIAIFQAYGILREDIVWVGEPVWVSSLVAAAPMWQNQIPHYVHPEIENTWSRISDNLVDLKVSKKQKIFISRTSNLSDRNCRNISQVEEYFANNGFEILYPERFDLSEQATIFRNAEVIAGFGGSGLFNIIHCKNLKNLIVLNQEAYTARNEHLFASVIGCRVDYFWSTPEISHPKGKWSQEAYVSAWDFDFSRNREGLDELIGSIDSV